MTNGFDRVAGFYDLLTRIVFGNAIRKSQLLFLQQLKSSRTVLVLGGGTGWWLNALLKLNPAIRITFIDASAKMLSIAKANVNGDSVQFIHGTQESIPLNEKYSAVVLFYFLDLFNSQELVAVANKIEASLQPGAQWLVADFVEEKKWHSVFSKIDVQLFSFYYGFSNEIFAGLEKRFAKQKFNAGGSEAHVRKFYLVDPVGMKDPCNTSFFQRGILLN